MIYTHKSGRFPCGYLSVRVTGDAVIGMLPSGEEVVTGWSVEAAEHYINLKLWRAM